MDVWATDQQLAVSSAEYASIGQAWQAAKKIEYSQQLKTTESDQTKVRRAYEPEDIRALKQASDRDLTIDGPTLAAEAFRHKLVDRVFVLLCPVIIASGLGFWPRHRCDLNLDQVEHLDGGIVYLKYEVVHDQ